MILRLRLPAGLGALAVVALLSGLAAAGPATAQVAPEKAIAVELNKLEPIGEACRAYLGVKNASAEAFDSLKLDLVRGDGEGVVAKRRAVQAAPLPAGKTSLKVFDIAGHDCAGIGSILLNDVLDCAPAPTEGAGCLALIAASARGSVPFIK
ncbi:MAG: Tat pathway signal protein [Kiloniellaceae bacterium]